MFKYDRINSSESMDINKTDDSRECIICHYYYFTKKNRYKACLCNGCRNLIQKSMEFVIVTATITSTCYY